MGTNDARNGNHRSTLGLRGRPLRQLDPQESHSGPQPAQSRSISHQSNEPRDKDPRERPKVGDRESLKPNGLHESVESNDLDLNEQGDDALTGAERGSG